MWRLKAALEIQHHPCLPALAFALVLPSTIAVAHVLRRWFRCSTSSIHHVGFNDKIKNAKQIPNISEGTEPAGSDKSSASLNPWSKCMCHHVPPTGKWQGKHVKSCNDLCVCVTLFFKGISRHLKEVWMNENTLPNWKSLYPLCVGTCCADCHRGWAAEQMAALESFTAWLSRASADIHFTWSLVMRWR